MLVTIPPLLSTTSPTATEFTVGDQTRTNESGQDYVAYLFAHDPDASGIIQCGSYMGNGSSNGPNVTLGWEPQFLLIKSATSSDSWWMFDSMRGLVAGGIDALLMADSSGSEYNGDDRVDPTPTGFKPKQPGSGINGSGQDYIYMAIRAPIPV